MLPYREYITLTYSPRLNITYLPLLVTYDLINTYTLDTIYDLTIYLP